jgi:Uma2 family endonuclease
MVTAVADPRPMTLEDFENLPESLDRYEILQGELIVSPPPVFEHQDIVQKISMALGTVVTAGKLGAVITSPVGVRLTPTNIVQPDILFLANAKRKLVVGGIVDGAPDLIVEVLSPSTQHYDRVRKMALYRESGVQEYWIVDPIKRAFEVYELVDCQYRPMKLTEDGKITSRTIPGVKIDPVALFDSVWWSA